MLEQVFILIETLSGIGALIALVFLAVKKRLALAALGLALAAVSFPAFRWVRDSYGSDSWQAWLLRVAGVLISVAFIWVAIHTWRKGRGSQINE
jgi:uncharacterized membrane protein YcjF (UPF0283 family)